MEPDKTVRAIDLCIDFSCSLSQYALDHYELDWLWTGDDVAIQQSMMMRPDTWRLFIKPGLKRLFEIAKERGLFIAYHCCGALRDIIHDLVDIGLDVLHPIQPNCPGMDPSELKREFGADLSFIGGSDTQGLIPHGSPQEVKEQTESLIETMTADGGGYFLAASHNIPPETPLENLFAIYEAVGQGRECLYERASEIHDEK